MMFLYLNAVLSVFCEPTGSHPPSSLDDPVYVTTKLPLGDSSRYKEPTSGLEGLFALGPLGIMNCPLCTSNEPLTITFSLNIHFPFIRLLLIYLILLPQN